MKQLFDPSKPHLTVCIWIDNPVSHWRIFQDERPSSIPGSPLHYAAFLGLHSIVYFLVIEHSQDVRSRSVKDDTTPLHLASGNGHKQVACFLLEHGADVSARDDYRKTPLHLALQLGHIDVAHMLIERGADVTVRTITGPPHYIRRCKVDK